MKRLFAFAAVGVALLLSFAAPPAHAACTFSPQPEQHVSSWYENCADANPVTGYSWKLGDAANVNTAGQKFTCISDSDTNAIGQDCPPTTGVAGDGLVTVFYEWGDVNPGAVGCPNPDQTVNGSNPLGFVVVCDDGASIIGSVGYALGFGGYLVDAAQPADMTGAPLPVGPSYGNAPTFVSNTLGSGSDHTICVNVPIPQALTDCDAGTFGESLGTCAGRTAPPTDRGMVYSTVAPCGEQPDLGTSNWTARGAPDTNGDLCFLSSAALTTGECEFVGITMILGAGGQGTCNTVDLGPCIDLSPPLGLYRCSGAATVTCDPADPNSCIFGTCAPPATGSCTQDSDCVIAPPETPAVVGTFQLAGPGSASDRAVLRLAELGRNVLDVEFTVSLEENAVSFDILAGDRVINDSPIAAEHRNVYDVTIDKAGGKLRGAKSIVVRTNLGGGDSLLSEPLTISRAKGH